MSVFLYYFRRDPGVIAAKTGDVEPPMLPIEKGPAGKEALMHRHMCSQCGAVVTLEDGDMCPSNRDHEDGLCEACILL
jgi:hypothetical protein